MTQEELFSQADSLLNAFFPDAFAKDVLGQLNNELLQMAMATPPEAKKVTDLIKKTELIFGGEKFLKTYTFLKQNWEVNMRLRNHENPPETHRVKYVGIDHPILHNVKAQVQSMTQKNMVITGYAGVGKSVLSEAVFKDACKSLPSSSNLGIPNSIFVEAIQLLSVDESVDLVFDAARSISYLGKSVLVVDGIDDLPDKILENLSVGISKLADYENLKVVISCRGEVLNNSPKVQSIRENPHFDHISLEPWDEKAVEEIVFNELGKERVGTLSPELLAVLTTPFFLDIFIDICAIDEKLNPDSELFRVKNYVQLLEKYKSARITAKRNSDVTGQNDCDARIEACNLLTERVLKNQLVFEKSIHPGGVDGLITNGVLIPTPGEKVTFRHRLLQDFIVADFLMGDLDSNSESSLQDIYDLLIGVKSVAVRNGIIQMFVAILFNISRGDIFANRTKWLTWLDKKSQDSGGDELFSATTIMWSRLSPLDYPKCNPDSWPDVAPRPTESLLISLINDVCALPERGMKYLTNQWWETAVQNWGEKCQIQNPLIVLYIVQLVKAVFKSSDGSIPNIPNACNKLIEWSENIADELSRFSGHYQLVNFVCENSETIPYEWIVKQAKIDNIRIRETVVENIHKISPLGKISEVFIRMYGVARQVEKDKPPRRWFFTDERKEMGTMMDHYLMQGLETSRIISNEPLNSVKAVAAIIDAHKYSEDRIYGDNGHEIFEDYSTSWYWEGGSRHPDYDTPNKVSDMILAVLVSAAKEDDSALFVSIKGILYETSDIVLFRTLVADALYQNSAMDLKWHENEWIEILTDCRLYSTHSMTFWLLWEIKRIFEKLGVGIQTKIFECIETLSSIPTYQDEFFSIVQDYLPAYAPHMLERLKYSKYWMKELEIKHPSEIVRNYDVNVSPIGFEESEYLKDWDDKENTPHFRALHDLIHEIKNISTGIESFEEDKMSDEIYPQIHRILQDTVPLMNDILVHKDEFLSNGYPLWWACTILENIRRVVFKPEFQKKNKPAENEKSKLDKEYLDLLGKYAPWVTEASLRALETLKDPSLSFNMDNPDRFDGTCGMPDPWICSVQFWDLAILPPVPEQLTAWDKEMQDVILQTPLPEKMRMYFILDFRIYNLYHHSRLHDMLWKWLEEAKDAKLIAWYFKPFWQVFESKRIEMMKTILEKENIVGSRHDLDFYCIAKNLSFCWYRTDKHGDGDIFAEFTRFAEQVINGELPKEQTRSLLFSFATYLVDAFRNGLIDNPAFCNIERLAEGLTRTIEKFFVVPPEEENDVKGNGTEIFLHLIGRCFELPKELDISKASTEKEDIWTALKPVILGLIKECDLGGLSTLMFSMRRDTAVGENQKLVIPFDWTNALDVIEAVLERINEFQKSGMTTNDFGYIGTLNGVDIVDFIMELLKPDRLNKPLTGSVNENRLSKIISRLDAMQTPKNNVLKQMFM